MLNRIILMGRLTRDPELRHTQTGTPVASFSLAVDRDFKDKTTGEKSTDFIDSVAWRQTAEFVSRFFTRVTMAMVSRRLQLRTGPTGTATSFCGGDLPTTCTSATQLGRGGGGQLCPPTGSSAPANAATAPPRHASGGSLTRGGDQFAEAL